MQKIRYIQNVSETLREVLEEQAPDRVFVLCDNHTERLCLPLLQHAGSVIAIPPTDEAKTLDTLTQVWQALQEGGATRHSLLVNLGGGMVTDLGGFAAATFKRGIRFVNVPTTLLAMVDAAVGGKTGINFGGLKNEIGAFREAEEVLVSTAFLATLDAENIRSGYAEMLKHSLLCSEAMWSAHLQFDIARPDLGQLQGLVQQSIEYKQSVVEADPYEKGLRKSLNLGHTLGHAIESLYLTRQKPLLHGYAVAWGLVAALYMSAVQCGFPTAKLHQTARYVFEHYGRPQVGCNDYDALLDFVRHDKKACGSRVGFTLLQDAGAVLLNQEVSHDLMLESIDFLRDA